MKANVNIMHMKYDSGRKCDISNNEKKKKVVSHSDILSKAFFLYSKDITSPRLSNTSYI